MPAGKPALKPASVLLDKKAYGDLAMLVVEDAAHMASLVCGILKSMGVGRIYEARNGDSALSILANYPVNVVLIDSLEPPLDGLAVVKTVRTAQAQFPKEVPVIYMTAQASKSSVVAARDAGVTEVLSKPFSATQLIARIESVLKKPRSLVESGSFVGPDRRRRENTPRERRRQSDKSE
ncbi:MAG TPA: response regulator [Parvibaculum sp.]|jgi:DNA-binding response OmpR family regulator